MMTIMTHLVRACPEQDSVLKAFRTLFFSMLVTVCEAFLSPFQLELREVKCLRLHNFRTLEPEHAPWSLQTLRSLLFIRQPPLPQPEYRTKRIFFFFFKIFLLFFFLYLKKDHECMPLTSFLIFVF